MTAAERWLDAMRPFVRDELPDRPASVVEIGCGLLGGFVPMMARAGHDAVGIDPEAPSGPGFERMEFERYEPPAPVDAVVASTSLHHVADLGMVLDRVAATLTPGGTIIVVEWASERFDLPTARWCFDRLDERDAHEEGEGWLHRLRDEWESSGLDWADYLHRWLQEERLHSGVEILRELDSRFDRQTCIFGPYFFPDLGATTVADEQAAIDSKRIQAGGIHYVARKR
jgi:SAM-dependent methyltransferase